MVAGSLSVPWGHSGAMLGTDSAGHLSPAYSHDDLFGGMFRGGRAEPGR